MWSQFLEETFARITLYVLLFIVSEKMNNVEAS